jgi:hypothetical protein
MSASVVFHGSAQQGDFWPRMLPLSASRAGKAQPRLRLTRRGRMVLIGLPLMLLAVLLMWLSGGLTAPAKGSGSQLSPSPTVSVTVQPGQSLWTIAAAVAPGRDTRDVIAEIVQLNNLDAGRVMPGQELFVPAH